MDRTDTTADDYERIDAEEDRPSRARGRWRP
jgi:hypothetical protein